MTQVTIRDEDWNRIEPLLPKKRTNRGRPSIDDRIIVEGILWVHRTGSPWRDLPESFPPWKTVYTRFWRWSKQGAWHPIWEILNAH